MSAKKKVAPAKEQDAAAPQESNEVAPVATKDGVPTYRTDMGESLPPQKHPGVE